MSNVQMSRWLDRTVIPGKATFFCTERFASLASQPHEISPHPDFPNSGGWLEAIDRMRIEFPNAKTWRSHSLFFSQAINVELQRRNYQAVSVVEQFGDKFPLPYKLPWGLTQFPIYYMDNSDFCDFSSERNRKHVPFSRELIDTAIAGSGVYVFDFHPIHLELNTPNFEYYASNRDQFKSGSHSRDVSFSGRGTRTFYEDLVAAMQLQNIFSKTLLEALELHCDPL
jgi:hypothetical protein